jgi:hypothetical protein
MSGGDAEQRIANQNKLVEDALRRILKPRESIIGEMRIQGWSIDYRQSTEILNEWARKTDKGQEIDPFEMADGNAWVIISSVFSSIQQNNFALQFALKFLDLCYDLQSKHGERIHKGAAHYWVAHYYELADYEDLARSHMILAFIEDAILTKEPKEAPAWYYLVSLLGFSVTGLDALDDFLKAMSKRKKNMMFFPEDAIVNYCSKSRKRFPFLLFPFNRHYLWFKCAQLKKRDKFGKNLELMMYYLLKTVPNLDVRWRVPTRAGEIDLAAINSGPLHEPSRWFEDFVGVECKDWAARVDTKEVEAFFAKLLVAKMRTGFIVSRHGLTGKSAKDNAKGLIHTLFMMKGIAILDLSIDELCAIDSVGTFLDLLNGKYEMVRLSKT